MTNVNVGSSSLQVVRSGSAGGSIAATYTAVQVVTNLHVDAVRVTDAMLQVIRSGSAGGVIRASSELAQVIYTVGVTASDRQRAWFFDLDGHTFYVLDLAENGALIYDATTQQWTHFETAGFGGHWNMKNGFHWRAGKQIVGGDISSGVIFELQPGQWLDEGWRPVVYEVRGAIFATDIETHRNFALRLIGSAGRTADSEAPKINMQFSDDNGATWSHEFEVTLTMDTRQRIEWRSLGAFSHPGRIFRLYDTGGVKFIAAVVADVEGAE